MVAKVQYLSDCAMERAGVKLNDQVTKFPTFVSAVA